MDKSTSITLPTQNVNIDRKDIKFIGQHNLNLDNKNYILKFGKVENKIEELIIFAKDENLIDTCYYQKCFSLENLQKVNNFFRQYDTIDEAIDALKDIISHKKISIKKENNELHIILKYVKLGKGEEEIIFILKKNNIESGKIIENLISNIDNLKLEIEQLKKEISNKKLKKYHPVLENGWIVDSYTAQEFIVCKNSDGQVSIQGIISGDWSKKIFTLEKEYRAKYRLTFPVIANQALNRIDILPNGDVYLCFHGNLGVQGIGWVNFSGITYYVGN
jgi:hypothetical protein